MGKNQLSRRDKKAQKRKEKFAKTCDEVSRKFREPSQSDCEVQHVTSRSDIHDGATLLHLTDIKMTAGRRVLLENAEIRLRKGRKYGLVGRNGLGKTTLLRNMVNGTFQIPSTIDMYLCEQDPVISKDVTVFQYLLDSNAKVTALQKEAERLEDEPDSIERLNTIYEELDAYRADASEARARKILKGLGFLEKMQNGKASSLSGGWVQRLSLARALYIQPDLLLLDEPTNHLDIDAVLWLQVYLHSWKKTLIVVSHYQDFLNQVCTDIIHLDNRTLTPYKGAYNVFQLVYEQRRNAYLHLKRKEKITKGRYHSDLTSTFSESEEVFVKFSFECINPLDISQLQDMENPILIGLQNATFAYGEKDILSGINFEVKINTRVVIVGPNGVGKTTFLKLLSGQLELTGGVRSLSSDVKLGVMAQSTELPMEVTPIEYLLRFNGEAKVKKVLTDLALEASTWRKDIKRLSGGQMTKVALAEVILSRPNVIILDEPTNNLDFESINALSEALRRFNGAVILVSHDQRTVDCINCEVWRISQRTIHKIVGGFPAYVKSIVTEAQI